MSTSCCMCEPMETAQCPGDDTHAVVAGTKWAREHGIHAKCGPIVGGLRAWPIDMCSNKDAGRSQSETPTLCECEQARRQILIRQDFCCGSSRVSATKHSGSQKVSKSCTPKKKTKKSQDRARTKQAKHNVCVHLSTCCAGVWTKCLQALSMSLTNWVVKGALARDRPDEPRRSRSQNHHHQHHHLHN